MTSRGNLNTLRQLFSWNSIWYNKSFYKQLIFRDLVLELYLTGIFYKLRMPSSYFLIKTIYFDFYIIETELYILKKRKLTKLFFNFSNINTWIKSFFLTSNLFFEDNRTASNLFNKENYKKIISNKIFSIISISTLLFFTNIKYFFLYRFFTLSYNKLISNYIFKSQPNLLFLTSEELKKNLFNKTNFSSQTNKTKYSSLNLKILNKKTKIQNFKRTNNKIKNKKLNFFIFSQFLKKIKSDKLYKIKKQISPSIIKELKHNENNQKISKLFFKIWKVIKKIKYQKKLKKKWYHDNQLNIFDKINSYIPIFYFIYYFLISNQLFLYKDLLKLFPKVCQWWFLVKYFFSFLGIKQQTYISYSYSKLLLTSLSSIIKLNVNIYNNYNLYRFWLIYRILSVFKLLSITFKDKWTIINTTYKNYFIFFLNLKHLCKSLFHPISNSRIKFSNITKSIFFLNMFFKKSINYDKSVTQRSQNKDLFNNFFFYDIFYNILNYLSNRLERTISSYTGIQCLFYPTIYLTYKPFIKDSKLLCEYIALNLETGSSINNVWKNVKYWLYKQKYLSDNVESSTLKKRIFSLSKNPLKGIRIICRGPNYRAKRKRKFVFHSWISDEFITGKMPFQSFSEQIDYYQSFAVMKHATIGIKVWTLFEFIVKRK